MGSLPQIVGIILYFYTYGTVFGAVTKNVVNGQIYLIGPNSVQNVTLSSNASVKVPNSTLYPNITTTTTLPTFDQVFAEARAKAVADRNSKRFQQTADITPPRVVKPRILFDDDDEDNVESFQLNSKASHNYRRFSDQPRNDQHLFFEQLNSEWRRVKSQRSQWRVCDGTNNHFSTVADEHTRYLQLHQRYEGCNIVDGNLELTFLAAGYNLTFLSTIHEVTGYVLISNCNVSTLPLSGLSIIRGRSLFQPGGERNLALYVNDNPNLSALDLRSLREVVRGRVNIVNNRALCYVNSIDWSDIVSDGDDDTMDSGSSPNIINSNILLQNNAPANVCSMRSGCAGRCPRNSTWTPYDDEQSHSALSLVAACWGPEPDQCQRRNKRNCAAQCQGGRCFGPDARQCCHAYCAGGCYGPLQSDCLSCRHFDDNGTCVLECPPHQIYDPNNYQLRQNPHVKYAYGSQCVAECPRHLLRDLGACVSKCPPGKQEAKNDRQCEPCPNGECARNCIGSDSTSGKDSTFINAKNIARYENCTVIQGDIIILQSTFDGMVVFEDEQGNVLDQPTHIAPLTPSALHKLANVREVTGSVIVEGAHPQLHTLAFLKNLRTIRGRQARKQNDDTFFSLKIIASAYLERLALRSLESVMNGGIMISRNPQLCLADTIKWLDMVEASNGNNNNNNNKKTQIIISNNALRANCSARHVTCHTQCDLHAGCWGIEATQCRKCRHFQLDDGEENRCIANCSMPGVYFNLTTTPYDSISNNTTTTTLTSSNVCHRCHEQCADSCFGPGPANCSTCKRARDGPFCVAHCPLGKYLNTQENGQCQPCHANCLDGCTGPLNSVGADGCNSCAVAILNNDQQVLSVDKCQQASSTCPWQYFAEYVQRGAARKSGGVLAALVGRIVCRKCDTMCARCSREGVECDECRFFRQDLICVEKCGDGYWSNNSNAVNRTCERCHPECDGCRGGADAENCLRCRNVRVYVDGGEKFKCSDQCPSTMPFKSLMSDVGDTVCTNNSSLSASSYFVDSPRSRKIVIATCLIGGLLLLGVVVAVFTAVSRARRNSIAMRAKELAMQLSPHAADDLFRHCPNNNADVSEPSSPAAKPSMGKLQIITLEDLSLATHPLGLGAFGFVREGIWKMPNPYYSTFYESGGAEKQLHDKSRRASGTSLSGARNNNNEDDDETSCADSGSVAAAAASSPHNTKCTNTLQLCSDTNNTFFSSPTTRSCNTIATSRLRRSEGRKYLKVPVAVKQLNDVTTNVETNSQFLDEACMMASIKHKHIVPLLGVCLTRQPMLVTPLMPYGSIQDFMKANRYNITATQMMRWFLQMAEGMSFLEENNVVHRDLAARNVLLQTPNFCRIADFGLAKLLFVNENEYTATPGSKLPLRWLALESILESRFTHKSDIWSFGVTLWEILMFGAKPYGDMPDLKPLTLAEYLLTGERLSQPPTASTYMFTLLVKCWAHKAEARPSFNMLVQQLQHLSRMPTSHIVIAQKNSTAEDFVDAQHQFRNSSSSFGLPQNQGGVANKCKVNSISSYAGAANFRTPLTQQPSIPPRSADCGTLISRRSAGMNNNGSGVVSAFSFDTCARRQQQLLNSNEQLSSGNAPNLLSFSPYNFSSNVQPKQYFTDINYNVAHQQQQKLLALTTANNNTIAERGIAEPATRIRLASAPVALTPANCPLLLAKPYTSAVHTPSHSFTSLRQKNAENKTYIGSAQHRQIMQTDAIACHNSNHLLAAETGTSSQRVRISTFSQPHLQTLGIAKSSSSACPAATKPSDGMQDRVWCANRVPQPPIISKRTPRPLTINYRSATTACEQPFHATQAAEQLYDDVLLDSDMSDNVFDTTSEATSCTPSTQPAKCFTFQPIAADKVSTAMVIGQSVSLQNSPIRKMFKQPSCEPAKTTGPLYHAREQPRASSLLS